MIAKNKKVISRLSRYKNALYRFKSLGFMKIFSDYLAEATGATSSQVRKDFSLFGIAGNKRGGYKIDDLLNQLNDILGKNKIQKVVIVGAGNMGAAMRNYAGFEKGGITIVAAFDIDPAKFTTAGTVPVFPMEKLSGYIQENNITIGIIAVPDIAAQHTMDTLVQAGIKGVLNFAPIALQAPEGVIVNNVNLELELENLIYFVNASEKSAL